MRKMPDEYLRSGVFGAEDALISTTGLVVGLSTNTQNKSFIILACFVAVAVAALSASTSELISDEAVQEVEHSETPNNPILSALIMFFSYLIAGLIPALPILLFEFPFSILGTVIFSILGFLVLGFIKAKFTGGSALRSIIQVLIIGGASALVGILVGYFLKV